MKKKFDDLMLDITTSVQSIEPEVQVGSNIRYNGKRAKVMHIDSESVAYFLIEDASGVLLTTYEFAQELEVLPSDITFDMLCNWMLTQFPVAGRKNNISNFDLVLLNILKYWREGLPLQEQDEKVKEYLTNIYDNKSRREQRSKKS